jgi:hypothetical protein
MGGVVFLPGFIFTVAVAVGVFGLFISFIRDKVIKGSSPSMTLL